MKKIIIGGAFLIGGYWLIKNFLNKDLGSLEKPKLEFKPTDTELIGTLEDGTEIRWSLEDRELQYNKFKEFRDNPKAIYGWTLFKDDFTEENTKGLRNNSTIKQLQNIKPYSIDFSALKNLNEGTFDLGFPSEEDMALAIEKYKTGTPTQPTWSR
ncbi:hypothetical protein KY321_02260 [Candidatus Woesearchaeota archaeon]|nr:hypothetical protein [Candidatus Woesearchaeota archaeon]